MKKEFGTLSNKFIVLLHTPAENYSDMAMETADIMSNKGKGVYVTASKPYRFISNEMQRRKINTDNILFLDCISSMAGEQSSENEKCTFVENPAAIEEISMHINSLLNGIESDEKFLIIDSISTFLIYNSANSVKEFSMSLINKLRSKGVNGIFMGIENDAPEDLKQSITAMCDKSIMFVN